jgi:uncharacterized protein with GYD domain
MAKYVVLLNWTEQGARAAKDTVKRAAAARQAFEKAGGRIAEVLWTLGQYDLVITADAPDDQTMCAISVSLGTLGNVRMCTLRAFDEKEMQQILQKV